MISRNCGLIRTGLMVGAGLALLSTFGMGCSSFLSQQSSLPTAKNLVQTCTDGLSKVPPVRDNACDIYDVVGGQCAAAAMSMVPGFVQACTVAGFSVQGGFIPMVKHPVQ